MNRQQAKTKQARTARMNQPNSQDHQQDHTLRDELKAHVVAACRRLEHWIRPTKGQPLALQILLFILKLPVILLLLALSPVVLAILAFIFVATL